jgi:hypothetical protein
MGNTLPPFLPGDVVRKLEKNRPSDETFIVQNITKDGLQFQNDTFWYPAILYFVERSETSDIRRTNYSMATSYERSCNYYHIPPIQTLYNEYLTSSKSGQKVFLMNLTNQSITDEHAISLLPFLKSGYLVSIDFSKNKITKWAGSQIMYDLYYNKTVKTLRLNENNLEGISYLSAFGQNNCTVSELDLSGTNIGSKGVHDLLDGILKNPNSKISKLGLKHNECQEEHIEKLLEISKRQILCQADIYPPKEGVIQDGWLNYHGWEMLGLLRDQMKQNLEDRSKRKNSEPQNMLHEAISYISYGITSFRDEIKSLHQKPLEGSQILHNHDDYETWKEKKNVNKDYIDLKNELHDETPRTPGKGGEDDWVVIEEKKSETKIRVNCPICLDEIPSDKIYILDCCDHKFCKNCITEYTRMKITDGETDSLTCPVLTCKREIEVKEIKQLLNSQEMKKYEDFSLKKALSKIPTVCYCPNRLCNNAIDVVGCESCMKCPACATVFCSACKVEWHQGMTCMEYQEWKVKSFESEKQYLEWILANAKNCPTCNVPISKISGCNHMKCKRCGSDFCWICGQKMVMNEKHFGNGKCTQY